MSGLLYGRGRAVKWGVQIARDERHGDGGRRAARKFFGVKNNEITRFAEAYSVTVTRARARANAHGVRLAERPSRSARARASTAVSERRGHVAARPSGTALPLGTGSPSGPGRAGPGRAGAGRGCGGM